MSPIIITEMKPDDWPAVEAIYLEGLRTGTATFETQSPGWENWDANHLRECRSVAVSDGHTVGWIALSPVSKRHVYRGVAEVSIYVAEAFRGKGVGRALFEELISQAEALGFWTLQSSVFRENLATIGLHKKMGFREIGYREKIGQLHGVWKDTVLLERRSNT